MKAGRLRQIFQTDIHDFQTKARVPVVSARIGDEDFLKLLVFRRQHRSVFCKAANASLRLFVSTYACTNKFPTSALSCPLHFEDRSEFELLPCQFLVAR